MGYAVLLVATLTFHALLTVTNIPAMVTIPCILTLCSFLIVQGEFSAMKVLIASIFLSASVCVAQNSEFAGSSLPLPEQTVSRCTATVLEDSNLGAFDTPVTSVMITSVEDLRNRTAFVNRKGLLFSGEFLYQGERIVCSDTEVSHEETMLFVKTRAVRREQKGKLLSLRIYLLERIRERLRERGAEDAGLPLLLMFAIPTAEGSQYLEKGRERGVSHLFVLSGFHLQLIVSLFEIFDRKGRFHLLSLLTSHLFVALCGYSPSLMRALISLTLNRTSRLSLSAKSLMVTFSFHLLIMPRQMFTYASTLSYTAVAAIILVVPLLRTLLFPFLPGFAGAALALCAGAFLGTAPLAYVLFGEIHPEGILYTLILSPLIFLLFIVTFVTAATPFPFVTSLFRFTVFCIGSVLEFRAIAPVTSMFPLIPASVLLLTWFLVQWYCSRILQRRSANRYEMDVSLRFAFRDNPAS